MIIRFTDEFYKQHKKADVRIRKQFAKQAESVVYFTAMGTHDQLYK